MILRGMPFYDRYLIPILPFIYIILGDCLYGSFEIIKNKWAAAIAAGAMFFLIILPVNPQLNTGAYFSENDGIEDTAILVKKSRDPIVYNIGVNSWVLSYYFFNVCKPGSLKNLKPEQSGEIPELDRNSKNDCFILTNPEIQAERAITDKFNAYEKIPVIKSGKLKYLIYKIHSPGRG
jgi:hypothetical protein